MKNTFQLYRPNFKFTGGVFSKNNYTAEYAHNQKEADKFFISLNKFLLDCGFKKTDIDMKVEGRTLRYLHIKKQWLTTKLVKDNWNINKIFISNGLRSNPIKTFITTGIDLDLDKYKAKMLDIYKTRKNAK